MGVLTPQGHSLPPGGSPNLSTLLACPGGDSQTRKVARRVTRRVSDSAWEYPHDRAQNLDTMNFRTMGERQDGLWEPSVAPRHIALRSMCMYCFIRQALLWVT